MRSLLVGVGMIVGAITVLLYGALLAAGLLMLRDWLHSHWLVWRMRRSPAVKRPVVQVVRVPVTFVTDDDGNVIDSTGNSWTVTG